MQNTIPTNDDIVKTSLWKSIRSFFNAVTNAARSSFHEFTKVVSETVQTKVLCMVALLIVGIGLQLFFAKQIELKGWRTVTIVLDIAVIVGAVIYFECHHLSVQVDANRQEVLSQQSDPAESSHEDTASVFELKEQLGSTG